MKAEEKSVTQQGQPMLKFERWMNFLEEGLTPRERAARKRFLKQIKKLFNRCIVKNCQAPLVDVHGRLRATNVVGKAVCRSCKKDHPRWYRWFRGKFTRTYFVNGNLFREELILMVLNDSRFAARFMMLPVNHQAG